MSVTAITVAPGSQFAVSVSGLPTGIAGSLGVWVADMDGAELYDLPEPNEVPAGSGTYVTTAIAPIGPGNYQVLWDEGPATVFRVAAPMLDQFGPEGPVVMGMVRQPSNVYRFSQESVYTWLCDEASFQRISDEPTGNDDGTPIYDKITYGPYAARLSQPDRGKQRQADKFTDNKTFTLLVACDVEPTESDYFDVVCQDPTRDPAVRGMPTGTTKRYRVLPGVEPRTPPWRVPLLWHVPVALTAEH